MDMFDMGRNDKFVDVSTRSLRPVKHPQIPLQTSAGASLQDGKSDQWCGSLRKIGMIGL
jgi:hypothetical protein